MRRIAIESRANWPATVESQGFLFHTPDGQPYWDESAYYLFSATEIDSIEKATYALDEMCLQAVQRVIDTSAFDSFQIPSPFHNYIRDSWERDEFTICGRFDLAYDGSGPPKLLEYNADTPTSLLEAAVIQWHWFKDVQSRLDPETTGLTKGSLGIPTDSTRAAAFDQFNSIHERLIEAWRALRGDSGRPAGLMHFSALAGHLEDYMTVNYLRDTAMQTGWETDYLNVERVGWNPERGAFLDEHERVIGNCFKLYPWEWLVREQYAPHLLQTAATTRWLEPPWKMLLSNKAILPLLWEMFPNSPYLLPASLRPLGRPYVRKPLLGREGANIQRVSGGQVLEETDGPYEGPYVHQSLQPIREFDGNYPVVGSWMVNGYACGIGIREDTSPITQNTSRFVPHVFAS